MFSKIMVPVDLSHADKLDKALAAAAHIAGDEHAELVYVAATSHNPSSVAHSPEGYQQKLEAFAAEQSERRGVKADAKTIVSHDPSIDLGDRLIATAKEIGADAIVMASHVPGVAEHVFASKAGYVASHAPVSVFVIR